MYDDLYLVKYQTSLAVNVYTITWGTEDVLPRTRKNTSNAVKLVKASTTGRNDDLLSFLKEENGSIIIDTSNLLKLRKETGQISFIGAKNSSFQGITITSKLEGIYEGSETCPGEYISAMKAIGYDTSTPYLFCSVDPNCLPYDKDFLGRVIHEKLIRDLFLDEEISAPELGTAANPVIISPAVIYGPNGEAVETEQEPEQPEEEPPLAEIVVLSEPVLKKEQFEALAIHKTQLPYFYVPRRKKIDGPDLLLTPDMIGISTDYVLKRTAAEAYLNTWKGGILIDLNPDMESYCSMQVGFYGNNQEFNDCMRFDRDFNELGQSSPSQSKIQSSRIRNRVYKNLGYHEKQACLYLGVRPDMLASKIEYIRFAINKLIQHIDFTDKKMDVEEYIFGAGEQKQSADVTSDTFWRNNEEYETSMEKKKKDHAKPLYETISKVDFRGNNAVQEKFRGYQHNISGFFSDIDTQDEIAAKQLRRADRLFNAVIHKKYSKRNPALNAFIDDAQDEICSFEDTLDIKGERLTP